MLETYNSKARVRRTSSVHASSNVETWCYSFTRLQSMRIVDQKPLQNLCQAMYNPLRDDSNKSENPCCSENTLLLSTTWELYCFSPIAFSGLTWLYRPNLSPVRTTLEQIFNISFTLCTWFDLIISTVQYCRIIACYNAVPCTQTWSSWPNLWTKCRLLFLGCSFVAIPDLKQIENCHANHNHSHQFTRLLFNADCKQSWSVIHKTEQSLSLWDT